MLYNQYGIGELIELEIFWHSYFEFSFCYVVDLIISKLGKMFHILTVFQNPYEHYLPGMSTALKEIMKVQQCCI